MNTVKAKKIKFHFEGDMKHCVHDVISVWLHELDETDDKVIAELLKQKVMKI